MSTPNPWQYVFAAWNVYVGLMFLILGYMCDTRMIGLMELLGSLLEFFDIVITMKSGIKGAWTRHAFGTAILLGVGTALVFGEMWGSQGTLLWWLVGSKWSRDFYIIRNSYVSVSRQVYFYLSSLYVSVMIVVYIGSNISWAQPTCCDRRRIYILGFLANLYGC